MHGGRVNKMNILSTGLEIFVRLCITSIFALARSSWWPVLIDAPKNEWHSMQLKEIYYIHSPSPKFSALPIQSLRTTDLWKRHLCVICRGMLVSASSKWYSKKPFFPEKTVFMGHKVKQVDSCLFAPCCTPSTLPKTCLSTCLRGRITGHAKGQTFLNTSDVSPDPLPCNFNLQSMHLAAAGFWFP